MASIPGRKMGLIMLICLMGMVSTGSSSGLDSSQSIGNYRLAPLSNEEENELPIKKAYPYVSEYKRLPVFNFGIGKRLSDGNGIKVVRPYSFGFGKRSLVRDLPALREGLAYLQRYRDDDEKRSGRVRMYEFGLGKRAVRSPSPMIKRGRWTRPYNFGLGKRSLPFQYEQENITLDREDMDDLQKSSNEDLMQRILYDLSKKFIVDNQDDIEQDD